MIFAKKDSKNKKLRALLPVVMLLMNPWIFRTCITFQNTFKRCCCWFRSPFLLACGESVDEPVDESVGIGPYWLEKIPTSIRSPLLRWLVSLHVVCPCLIYPRVVLVPLDSSAESIYGLDEAVRVPERVPPILVLADSQPYHGDHQVDASDHSCCYYYCSIRPLCFVYAGLGGCSL